MARLWIPMGTLLVLVLASAIYVQLPTDTVDAKMRIGEDNARFSVLEDGYWRTAGLEVSRMYNGVSRMNRDRSAYTLTNYTEGDYFVVERMTVYQRGPAIIDTWKYDVTTDDIEQFPVVHEIEVFNGSGYIFQYEVRELVYNGPTIKNVSSPQLFGRNMKVEWEDGWYWSKVYKSGILKVRYRPTSDYEKYSVRLYDPFVQGVCGQELTSDIVFKLRTSQAAPTTLST